MKKHTLNNTAARRRVQRKHRHRRTLKRHKQFDIFMHVKYSPQTRKRVMDGAS